MPVKELTHIAPSMGGSASDAWRACVGRHMLPGLEITPSRDDAVFGDLVAFDFAGARLWSIRSAAQRVVRRNCASQRRFVPVAIFQVSGAARLAQGGRSCHLEPGTFAFVNAADPLELDHLSDFEQLYLQFPDRAFVPSLFCRSVSIPMRGQDTIDRPLFDCTRNLWEAAPGLRITEHHPALSALVSLCSLTSAFRHARHETETQLPVRVERAIAYIEHHLGDENLKPQQVAAAQRISRRYLDELFAQCGHSIESWIWERRLERAARELSAADSAHRSLLQIALDVGFKSPSHFSRSFAKRFGVSPRSFRRRQSRDVTPAS